MQQLPGNPRFSCSKIGRQAEVQDLSAARQQRLGAGREKAGEPVDPHAGIQIDIKLGNRIEVGQPLVTLFAAHPALLREPEKLLRENITISSEPAQIPPLAHEIVPAENAN